MNLDQVPTDNKRTSSFTVKSVLRAILKLHLKEFTGKILLTKGKTKKSIYFKDGDPVYVDSSIRSETLGQMLVKQGKLTDDQYLTVLIQMHAEGRRQGEILQELGYLSSMEILEALQTQTEYKIQSSFLMRGAQANIESGEEVLAKIPLIPVDFFRIFLNTFYALFKAKKISRVPADQLLRLSEDGKERFSKYKFHEVEEHLLEHLDGSKMAPEIIGSVSDDQNRPEAFLEALHYAGFIESTSQETLELAEPTETSEVETIPLSPNWELEHAVSSNQVRSEATLHHPLAEKIQNWAVRLTQSAHDLFNVTADADVEVARLNFEKIVEELHLRDIENSYAPDDHLVAQRVLDRLRIALQEFSDEQDRKLRTAKLKPKVVERTPSSAPTISAEIRVQKAKLLVRKQQFEKAEEEFMKAIEVAPKEASYRVEFAAALLQQVITLRKKILKRVEEQLREAVRIDPSHHEAAYELGRLAMLRGHRERARDCFARVLELRPFHPRALAALSRIEKGITDKKDQFSTFHNLFKEP